MARFGGITLSKEDEASLRPGGWLTDAVLTAWEAWIEGTYPAITQRADVLIVQPPTVQILREIHGDESLPPAGCTLTLCVSSQKTCRHRDAVGHPGATPMARPQDDLSPALRRAADSRHVRHPLVRLFPSLASLV